MTSHLHLGHLTDAFFQRDLQKVHLSLERNHDISVDRVKDKTIEPIVKPSSEDQSCYLWTNVFWVFCGRWRVNLLSWHWQGVCFRCQNRDESQLRWAGFVSSQWWRYRLASWCSRVKCSCWSVWSDQRLKVDGSSSVDGPEDPHLRLKSDAGCNRKPMEVTEEGGCRAWESSQEWVTVV